MAPDITTMPTSPRPEAARRTSSQQATTFPPLMQSVSTSSSSSSMAEVPMRHPRPLTAAELHLQLEKEQEAVVNRLTRELSALRAQTASVASTASSSTTTTSASVPGEDHSGLPQPPSSRPTSAAWTHPPSPSYTRFHSRRRSSNVSTASLAQQHQATSAPIAHQQQQPTSQASIDRTRAISTTTSSHRPSGASGGASPIAPSYMLQPIPSPALPSSTSANASAGGAPYTPTSPHPYHPRRQNSTTHAGRDRTRDRSESSTSISSARYEEASQARQALEEAQREREGLVARVRELEGLLRDVKDGAGEGTTAAAAGAAR